MPESLDSHLPPSLSKRLQETLKALNNTCAPKGIKRDDSFNKLSGAVQTFRDNESTVCKPGASGAGMHKEELHSI